MAQGLQKVGKVSDFTLCFGHHKLEHLGELYIASEGPSIGHDLAEGKVLDESKPFLLDHLGSCSNDDPVDLGLGRTHGNTALAEKAFADDVPQFVREFLITL